jgi:hypothetical protein
MLVAIRLPATLEYLRVPLEVAATPEELDALLLRYAARAIAFTRK